jgi:hypothetical protein
VTLASAALLASCVDNRIVITSEPSGAVVELNDVVVGRTPVEVSYTYTGVYDVRLDAPGHEPLSTSADTGVSFREWPVIDLISQAIPPTDRRRVEWHFVLEPLDTDREALLERARSLRMRARAEPGEDTNKAPPTGDEPPTPPADAPDRDRTPPG